MKDEIINICETCDKELKNKIEYLKHFNRNHTLRVKGQISIPTEKIDIPRNTKIGTALTNAKAGEQVIVRLE